MKMVNMQIKSIPQEQTVCNTNLVGVMVKNTSQQRAFIERN